jgi:MoxR-like ATPase
MSSLPRREASPAVDPISELSFDALSREAHALRDRLNRFRLALGRHFVGKQDLVDLMTVAAVAQEPLLLVGPPGTAKSDLVLKFRDALRIPNEDYFEYLLTRFTEPSEVLGPIDINLLRQGRYIRREGGKLPTARLVFLDEVFKASSAILNALLTVINERKFYQDGAPQPVRLSTRNWARSRTASASRPRAARYRTATSWSCSTPAWTRRPTAR